jgi:hypothetical protein
LSPRIKEDNLALFATTEVIDEVKVKTIPIPWGSE